MAISKDSLTERSRRLTAAREEALSVDIGAPPPAEDLQAQAQYFIDLIDALGKQGTKEARRLRSALIRVVVDYGEGAKVDRERATDELRAKLYGVEMGAIDVLLKSVAKFRTKLEEQAKRQSASPQGRALRTAAAGFDQVVDALETMQVAQRTGDYVKRDEANRKMEAARRALKAVPK